MRSSTVGGLQLKVTVTESKASSIADEVGNPLVWSQFQSKWFILVFRNLDKSRRDSRLLVQAGAAAVQGPTAFP
jgi:hypothetical protein